MEFKCRRTSERIKRGERDVNGHTASVKARVVYDQYGPKLLGVKFHEEVSYTITIISISIDISINQSGGIQMINLRIFQ